MKTRLIKKADIIIAVILISAGIMTMFFLRSGRGRIAVIEYDGSIVKTVNLSEVIEEYTFTVKGDLDVEITVSPKGIGFTQSSCPDKLCIKFGILSKRGEMASCVPARVSIRITGEGKIPLDGITG